MAEPSSSVEEVIERMRATVAGLPAADGISCFARLYLAVTSGVQGGLAAQSFADSRFLSRLDTVFADLFFTALAAFETSPSRAPRAWAPLFESRARRGIAPLQYALAGMNAHINRDLPVAIVATCRELGVPVAEGSAEHTDFLRVNTVLASVEAGIKGQYLTGRLRRIDRLVHRIHRLDDVVAMWDVRRARDAAWVNAEALWALQGEPGIAAQYLAALDHSVGFAGRGLLIPADTWLQRLARRL